MTKVTLPGATRLSVRQEYERTWNGTLQIWCWDGRNNNDRRRAIYPKYKAQREPMAEDYFSQIKLFREILTHTPAIQIECDGWEADDVAGTLARKFAAAGHQVTCYSNDLDWSQLEANPNINIDGIQKRPTMPRWIPLYKALVGDTSDNISGVAGFGPGTWTKLKPYWEEIEDAIRNRGSLSHLPLPPRLRNLVVDDELRNSLLITHIFPVPDDEIAAGTTLGQPNREAAEQILGNYYL